MVKALTKTSSRVDSLHEGYTTSSFTSRIIHQMSNEISSAVLIYSLAAYTMVLRPRNGDLVRQQEAQEDLRVASLAATRAWRRLRTQGSGVTCRSGRCSVS